MARQWSTFDVDWLVSRFHVSTTPEELTAKLRRRMPASKGWTNASRAEAIEYALKVHAANRDLYGAVMGGGWWLDPDNANRET